MQSETLCFPNGTFIIRQVAGGHRPGKSCPKDYSGTAMTRSYPDDGAIPILSSVSPDRINPTNRYSWNIRVYGERFDASCKIHFDGVELQTSVHSSNELTAYLLSEKAALPQGAHKITVSKSGAYESDPLTLLVTTKPPAVQTGYGQGVANAAV